MRRFSGECFCRVLAASALLVLAACAPSALPAPTSAPATGAPTPAAEQATRPAAQPAAESTASPIARAAFDEQAVASFYQGKTVKIIVGLSPGGGYDTFARLLARQLPKYIPGRPSVIVENRPGAASLVAANAVFNTEPKDGTVIGNFNENLVLQQALGAEGIQFDARQFQWLGSLEKGQPACVIRTDRGVTSMDDLLNGETLAIGTQGPGSYSHTVPMALNEALGTQLKIVPGYGGTSQMRLAIEAGEVDGGCWTWSTMRSVVQPWLEGSNPFAKILVIMGKTVPNDPLLAGTPAAETLAKTEEARQLLAAVNAPTEMTKPYAVAPGVPKDRVEALRRAFDNAVKDPEFVSQAREAQLEAQPSSAAEVERTVSELLTLPPAIIERVRRVTQ